MKRANKEKKKLTVTRKDLHTEDEKSPFYDLNRMAYTGIYEVRIRKYLFEKGQLSPKGFLFNNDILTLPGIAKRNGKGEILLDNHINELLERFRLSQNLFNSGNELLALLVDVDDALYERIKDAPNKDDVFQGEEIKIEASKAYDRILDILIDFDVNSYILNEEELSKLAIKK